MDRCTGPRDIIEILLKMSLYDLQSIKWERENFGEKERKKCLLPPFFPPFLTLFTKTFSFKTVENTDVFDKGFK